MSPELARHLCHVSRQIGRQVGVFLGRDGSVRQVMVGDANSVDLPDVGRFRGGPGRFRGVRLVHTHLNGEPLTVDDLNDLALLRLDLVAAIQTLPDGGPGTVEAAYLVPTNPSEDGEANEPFARVQAPDVFRLEFDFHSTITAVEAELARQLRSAGPVDQERALVVGAQQDDDRYEETLELVRSAGLAIAGEIRQKRSRVDPRTVVGRGKLQEVVLEGMRQRAEVAVFDVDLRPAQARAFENATGMTAIDRTQLILDIFAQRARSRAGKLQVELAQLKYSLPRLVEKDERLSRLTGGIGARGPGETVLEVGRRRINDRIRNLEKEIDRIGRQRDLRRQRRKRSGVPVLSIIGYTNAGKTTLLNALTRSDVEVADKLFSTLDPTSRRLRFPREGEVIITDTVGFIADLPRDLVTAFRATLEELAEADLLLHVIDASDELVDEKVTAVEGVLGQLHLQDMPVLSVLNKADLLSREEGQAVAAIHQGVLVSARSRQGLPELIMAAEERLARREPLLRDYTEGTRTYSK